MLRTDSLTKLYGVVIGVNDVSLALEPGVVGLLGPNGAGKSTLLKLVTGQLKPTEGSLEVLGERPWNNPGLFHRVGLCPEQDAFYDHLSALEFVTALARMSGLGRRARSAAEHALERVNATPFMHRPIASYSKGMRQRTKVAQALVHEPELLILDEPLTGTDPIGRRELMDVVLRLGAEGKSILVSSHVLHEVQAMTDRFVLLYGGRVLASGNVSEIRSLLNEHPHQITLRTPGARELAHRIVRDLPVDGIEIADDRLQVKTRSPGAFYAGLADVVLEAGRPVVEMATADDELESVFHYLISGDP